MPFIELGHEFGEAKEADLAPEGKPFDLVCHEIDEHKKNEKTSIRVTIKIEDAEQNYAPFSHFLPLPHLELDQRNDEEKGHSPGTTSQAKLLMIKRFLNAFRVPFSNSGFDPQDIRGSRARLSLKQEIYDGRRNQRLVLPNLSTEVLATAVQAVKKKKAKI